MNRCPQCGAAVDDSDRFCASCGSGLEKSEESSSPGDPLIGRTIGGAYLIQELVGVGGMGRVYRGIQNALGRTVAIKVVHPHLLGDEQTAARFYNEARAASRLNHPSSVGVIDFGRTDDGNLYLVMEFLQGKDLGAVLAEDGPLPFPRIVKTLRKVLGALSEAHALGVIHRDLKPENVITIKGRKGEETVKVVDFGLATITGGQSSSITTPGLVCGTPDYMSPEQGRGDQLDPRSDLYSIGVVLFEMLADKLPFIDDTPTKVVMRHIHDPVPDPRAVAPQRAIPPVLAEIAMKALAKDPGDRFATADEMDEALRQAEALIEARGGEVRCGSCGATNTSASRFCAECGARLTGVMTVPPGVRGSLTPAPRASTAPPLPRATLVGRTAELERWAQLRLAAHNRPAWLRLSGDAGVGKTRLLSEFAARAMASKDVVVMAGPHPSWAPVPYWSARAVLAALLDVPVDQLSKVADQAMISEPLVRAGLAEVADPKGLVGVPGGSRAGAVGAALRAAARAAMGRSGSGFVALLVDDLHRVDGLSRAAFVSMYEDAGDMSSLIVVSAQAAGRETSGAPTGSAGMQLRGLDANEAAHFMSGTSPEARAVSREDPTNPGTRLYMPLYLEQLRALGSTSIDDAEPPRLGDVIMQRVERLDVRARRFLQAASTLGERCDLSALPELCAPGDLEGFDTLLKQGLVRMRDGQVEIAHPFIRELVEASIPAEARKELHQKALAYASQHGAALEIRAEHAFKAGEPMSALLLLERMGDAALSRGDASGAVLAFRRGLDVARRELMISGEVSLDRAIVTFSRKLGQALEASTDLIGADGVLREALELVGPAHKERAKMLLQLGRVAARRDKSRDATRLLGQAIEAAGKTSDKISEADAQLELGRVRRADGDLVAAANTLRRACEILATTPGMDAALAAAELELVEVLVQLGDGDLATERLAIAQARARASGAGSLVARVSALRAAARAAAGDPAGAANLYQEAADLASEAGDARAADSFRQKANVRAA